MGKMLCMLNVIYVWSSYDWAGAVGQTLAMFELHFPASDSFKDQEGQSIMVHLFLVVGRDLWDRKWKFTS